MNTPTIIHVIVWTIIMAFMASIFPADPPLFEQVGQISIKLIKKFYWWITGNRWEVVRIIWPHEEGYATHNAGRNIVGDTGLSKEEAQQRCDQLNAAR